MPWAYSRPALLSLRYKQTFSGSEHSPEILPDKKKGGDNFPCINNHGLFPSPYPSPLHSVSSGACFLHILITIITTASVPCFRHLLCPRLTISCHPHCSTMQFGLQVSLLQIRNRGRVTSPHGYIVPLSAPTQASGFKALILHTQVILPQTPFFLLKQYFHWQEHFTATNVSSPRH